MSKTQECLEILKRGGIYNSKELSEELSITKIGVHKIVQQLRRSHLKTGKSPYVFTTNKGYSLEASPSGVIYESGIRMKMSIGVVLNGLPAFQKAKKIASAQFGKLKAQYNPELLKIGNL